MNTATKPPRVPNEMDLVWERVRALTPKGAILRELAGRVHLSLEGIEVAFSVEHLPALRAVVALLEGQSTARRR